MNIIQKIAFSLCCLWFTANLALAQEEISYIPEGSYLVIGTFHIKSNAIGFTKYVKETTDYTVSMAYHPLKKFYYVYIKGYGPNENGLNDVKKMRQETEFIDSWYMVVEPYEIPGKATAATGAGQPPKPAPEAPSAGSKEEVNAAAEDENTKPVTVPEEETGGSAWVKVSSNTSDEQVNNKPEEETGKDAWVKVSSNSGSEQTNSDPTKESIAPEAIPKTYFGQGKYKMFFNTFYIKNYKEVKGPVEIINPKTLKILRVAQSLELVKVPDPNNGNHAIQLIANIFGYKKVQHDIKLDDPLDSISMEFFHFKGDTLIADFPLRRYEVGDIATMYNVYFFRDAVIMKPISKFELNSLVDMLKENESLRIRIHGHTNGKAPGKILLMPEGSDNYFSLNQDIIEEKGSAKELSLQRAETIKRYLISYGISPYRMEIKGWGGKKPLYDKMDKLAIKNVRVEIEILEN